MILKIRTTLEKVRQKLKFPADFLNFQRAFSISGRLCKKIDNFSHFRTTFGKSFWKSQKESDFFKVGTTLWKSVEPRRNRSAGTSVKALRFAERLHGRGL